MTESSGGSSFEDQPGASSGAAGEGGPSGAHAGGEAGRQATGREWVSQLQSMIDNAATQAAPVLRDIAAKAAELAATAGEKAGPLAYKAAEVTESAGAKLAVRGREVAAELRREADGHDGHDGGTGFEAHGEGAGAGDRPNTVEPGPGATSDPGNPRPGVVPDSADTLGE